MSNSFLLFDPIFPLWISLGMAGVVMIIVLLLEWRRNLRFLTGRIIAAVVMTFGLLGIIIRPQIPFQIGNTIIVTPGATAKQIDSLLNILPDAERIRLDSNSIDLIRAIPNIRDHLYITGNGIPVSEIDYLKDIDFQYVAGELPTGIVELAAPSKFKLHQRNTIHGVYNLQDRIWLKLMSPSGVEDSVFVGANSLTPFSLSFTPTQSGKFLYQINEVNSEGRIVRSNNLPVIVEDFSPISILFLLNYPTSEVRFLKNFLTEQGHQLTLRYKVSNDRYRTEIVNDANEIRSLTKETLAGYDLIITDQDGIQAFSRIEHLNLQSEIENGLGFLLLISQPLDKVSSNYFGEAIFTESKLDSVTIILSGITTPVLTSQLKSNGTNPILSATNKNIVQGFIYDGLGKVGFQLLKNTYTFQLQGDDDRYAEIWSPLIQQLARKKNPTFKITSNTDFPIYAGDPYDFDIISTGNEPKASHDGNKIPLIEKTFVDDWWSGRTWFVKTGWQSIKLQDSTMTDVFVSQRGEWNSLRIMNQIKAHGKLAGVDTLNSSPIRSGRTPVPAWIFYLSFLSGFAFLWLAPKL